MNWDQCPPGLPFRSFDELREAVDRRRFSVGVDSLAAARWSDISASLPKRAAISALSLLLIAAALASAFVAIIFENYWLLAAIPIQAAVFYLSHSGYAKRNWVTLGGIASLVVFVNLLLNHLTTAAVLTAYAGLTFATVRAAGFTVNSAFRRALLSNEQLFLVAYENRACTLKEKSNGRTYGA